MNTWFFLHGPQYPYKYAVDHINHPITSSGLGWACRSLGAVVMVALMLMRYRLVWWPLHPIGFGIGAVSWIDELWLSIFIVWLLKSCILKFAGSGVYRKARPLFLGLILGQYSAACIWVLIDLATNHTGNKVFWI